MRPPPDDRFIYCTSFEERCISSALKMGAGFRTRFAIIFLIEETFCKKQVDNNLFFFILPSWKVFWISLNAFIVSYFSPPHLRYLTRTL